MFLVDAWEILYPGSLENRIETVKSIVKPTPAVKCSYSTKLKQKVKEYLKEYSIARTYLILNRRIPRSTLFDWQKEDKISKAVNKQGRKTHLRILEEELYLWFLNARARKIAINQSTLVKKALKLSKSILMDPEVTLSPQEKEAYTNFTASNGWCEKFRGRYNIAHRFITTRCTKHADEIKASLESYFKELNEYIEAKKPTKIYNMDEMCVFFELSHDTTLEIKGKKTIETFSTGKDKERVTLIITAASDGTLLPPLLLFKAPKPRSKTFKDHPDKEDMEFHDKKTQRLIDESGLTALRSYSGWNNKRLMKEYFIPYFKTYSVNNSLLLLDNHGSHTADSTVKAFEENEIKVINLAPNTTCISQPVDVGVGGVIKGKIKNFFEEWVVDNWENNNFMKYDEKKKKYKFTAPSKNQVVEWIIRAYEEISLSTVRKGIVLF